MNKSPVFPEAIAILFVTPCCRDLSATGRCFFTTFIRHSGSSCVREPYLGDCALVQVMKASFRFPDQVRVAAPQRPDSICG